MSTESLSIAPSGTTEDRKTLRRHYRAVRRNLGRRAQADAAQSLSLRMTRTSWFRRARTIAFYLPRDGEIDPLPCLRLALNLGKTAFLPVLNARGNGLTFRRYQPGKRMRRNRFGIPEPSPAAGDCALTKLDLLLMPLVAFDNKGNRLGMGGGFYDRTTHRYRHWAYPRRIGLAHSVQQHPSLPCAAWDTPLHAVMTERSTLVFRPRHR